MYEFNDKLHFRIYQLKGDLEYTVNAIPKYDLNAVRYHRIA